MQRLTAEDAVQIYRNNFEVKKEQYDFENRAEIDELIDKIDSQISNDASKLNTNSILYIKDFEIMLGHKLTDIDAKLLLSILKDYYKKQGFRVSGFDDNLTLGWNSDLFKKDNVKDSNKSLDKYRAALRQNIQTRIQKAAPEVDDKSSAKCDDAESNHLASYFAKHAGILREKLRAQIEKAAQDTDDKVDEAKPFVDNSETSEDNSKAPNDKQVEFADDQDKFIAKMLKDNLEDEDGSQGSESDNKSEALDNDAIANDDLDADDEPDALDNDAIVNDNLVAADEPEALDNDTIANDVDLFADDEPEALDNDVIANNDLVANDEPKALDNDTIANDDDLVANDEPEVADSIDDAESDTDLQANDANKKTPLPTLDSQINNLLNQQFQDADSQHTDSKNSHLTD